MGDTAETRRRHNTGDVVAGRYVLERELGEGGMGVVWVARSVALDVMVALKMLRGELAGTDAVERMSREARTAAQLGHPALVRMLDYGTSDDGEPFLVMELLRGEELHSILGREGRLSPARAVGLLLPVIDGLATAHEKGIIHRDIKPENIFIAQDEQGRLQPKVLDFGIAKRGGGPVSRLTQEGAVLGSPQYFSPEQAEGVDEIDFRSDIWAIGIVLYELVTGSQPFGGRNYNALIRSISQDAPAPIMQRGVGEPRLWGIIERCLQKKPENRWDSLWELGESLALWLFENGVHVDASGRSLKDSWLGGAVTGVKTLVGSVPPEGPITVRQQPDPSPSAPAKERSAGFVSTIRRPTGERAIWQRPLPWLAFLAFAAVVLVLFIVRQMSQEESAAFEAAPVPSQAAATASATASPPVAEAPSVASPPEEPPPSSATKSAPSASARSSSRKAGSKAPAPSPSPSAAREKAPPQPQPSPPKLRSGVDTEFGF